MAFADAVMWRIGEWTLRRCGMSESRTPTARGRVGERVEGIDAVPAWSADAIHKQKMEAVGQLAGGIAHDLSNLMTAMFGWLEIASSQLPTDHAARAPLKMVDRAARQAVGLTRSLLTFSHRALAEKRRILLNDAVRDVSRLLARLLPAAIEQRSIIPEEPVWVDGDDPQIQQVLMNLALNARDAIDGTGSIEIALDTLPHSDASPAAAPDRFPQGAACLRVTDSGCGIPESARSRIFEPFFTTKDRDRGTGLGLSIVHAIVSDCGGSIGMESQVGRGSRFTVYLPRRSAAVASSADTGAATGGLSGRGGVLVIEDHPHVRAMLTTVLIDAGYRVFEAADGDQGRTLFEEHRSDIAVAVVDIDLPKTNGLDVLASLRASQPDTHGVAITGCPPTADAKRRLHDLGCSLLRKPFQVAELKQLVSSVVRARRSGEGSR